MPLRRTRRSGPDFHNVLCWNDQRQLVPIVALGIHPRTKDYKGVRSAASIADNGAAATGGSLRVAKKRSNVLDCVGVGVDVGANQKKMVEAAKRIAVATIKHAAKSSVTRTSSTRNTEHLLDAGVQFLRGPCCGQGRHIYCLPIKGLIPSFLFTTYYFRKKDKCVLFVYAVSSALLLAIQMETVD